MKKKLFSLIICILILSGTYAQVTYQKVYGGEGVESGYDMQPTSDGGYIIAGQTSSTGAGGTDVYLIKTDAYGDTLWTRAYGDTAHNWAYSVAQAADGGYILAGVTRTNGVYTIYAAKTDSSGNLAWSNRYAGGAAAGNGSCALQTSDGGFAILGFTGNYGAGGNDFILIKTNNAGNVLWAKTYGLSSEDIGTDMKETPDGGFIITGRILVPGNSMDMGLIKTDSNGNLQWAKAYGSPGFDNSISVALTADGGYILAGTSDYFGPNFLYTYLVKTDSSGGLLWSRIFSADATNEDAGYSVGQASDGGYFITGYTGNVLGDLGYMSLIRTDSSGNLQWFRAYGGNSGETGFAVHQNADGGFVIAGHSFSYPLLNFNAYFVKTDPNGISGCNDYTGLMTQATPATNTYVPAIMVTSPTIPSAPVIVSASTGSTIFPLCLITNMVEAAAKEISLFPNPFTAQATITFKREINNATLHLYNLYGQMILEKSNINGESVQLNRGNLLSGVYLYEVIEKGKKIYTGKAVVY